MTKSGEILFKGTKGGLLVRLEGEGNFDRLKERLAERLEAAQKFFTGSAVTLDIGNRLLTSRQLLELESLFNHRYGVRVLQVVNGGLDPANERERDPASGAEVLMIQEDLPPLPANALPGTGSGLAPEEVFSGNTLLVKRTLRSGQRITHNGNVVILGDVNPGAEVVASGDIVVMGVLRGVVHAGATGDERAVIVAFRLRSTQLRIGSHISRAPDDEPVIGPELPEIARIKGGEIFIDLYSGQNRLEDPEPAGR